MIVVNLIGAPGSGKSTGATYIFSQLKMAGVDAEYVSEFAKDKTWGEDFLSLQCQEYVFGKQSMRLFRVKDKVEVAVTDSPLLLSTMYNKSEVLGQSFNQTVLNVFNSYDNMTYFVNRTKPYNPNGRNQTEAESDQIAKNILEFLNRNAVRFYQIDGCRKDYDMVVDDVLHRLGKYRIYDKSYIEARRERYGGWVI